MTAFGQNMTAVGPDVTSDVTTHPGIFAFVTVNMVISVVGNSLILLVFIWRWRSTGATKVSMPENGQ